MKRKLTYGGGNVTRDSTREADLHVLKGKVDGKKIRGRNIWIIF